MNTHQLKKRYQKSHAEIVDMIQLHLNELTDHARYDKGVWHLDNKAVEIMDNIMNDLPQENNSMSNVGHPDADEEAPKISAEATEDTASSGESESTAGEEEPAAVGEVTMLKHRTPRRRLCQRAGELAGKIYSYSRWP